MGLQQYPGTYSESIYTFQTSYCFFRLPLHWLKYSSLPAAAGASFFLPGLRRGERPGAAAGRRPAAGAARRDRSAWAPPHRAVDKEGAPRRRGGLRHSTAGFRAARRAAGHPGGGGPGRQLPRAAPWAGPRRQRAPRRLRTASVTVGEASGGNRYPLPASRGSPGLGRRGAEGAVASPRPGPGPPRGAEPLRGPVPPAVPADPPVTPAASPTPGAPERRPDALCFCLWFPHPSRSFSFAATVKEETEASSGVRKEEMHGLCFR
ncbi:translation initiation factor IF-2-like [Falco naumanni]|uniref:translation initiation factor IF-2-like n=1 Tax=Falco naumanni TaxID=148594 RepID=UPI001ADDFBD0|nr:translation initiation factor IF-2-like [Falco naumanni]